MRSPTPRLTARIFSLVLSTLVSTGTAACTPRTAPAGARAGTGPVVVQGEATPAGAQGPLRPDLNGAGTAEEAGPPPDGARGLPADLEAGATVRLEGRPVRLPGSARDQSGQWMVPVDSLPDLLGIRLQGPDPEGWWQAGRGSRRVRVKEGLPVAIVTEDGRSRREAFAPAPQLDGDALFVPLVPMAQVLGLRVEAQGAGGLTTVTRPPSDPHRTVFLTFDDGPSGLTPRVLDVLREYAVPATFFLIGRQAEAHPDLVRRMAAEGHALGSHSWDHDYAHVYPSPEAFARSVEQGAEAVERLTGRPVRLARAPGGTGTIALRGRNRQPYWDAAAGRGFTLVNWNVVSGDAASPAPTAAELLRTVQAQVSGPGKGPLVVLMHDSAGHQATLEMLPRLIEWLLRQGYDFQALTPERVPPSVRPPAPPGSQPAPSAASG